MHELLVALDLMRKGYHVFRALSPACPCDLAVVSGGTTYRIEVTSGYRAKNGRVATPADKAKQSHKYDVLAIVVDGEIIYRGTELPSLAAA